MKVPMGISLVILYETPKRGNDAVRLRLMGNRDCGGKVKRNSGYGETRWGSGTGWRHFPRTDPHCCWIAAADSLYRRQPFYSCLWAASAASAICFNVWKNNGDWP
jgi:hypothetical protein